MAEVRRAVPDDWEIVREVRFEALRDTPDFFWMTYEEEKDLSEREWRERIATDAWFLAEIEGLIAGIAAGAGDWNERPGVRQLISMYVRAESRGKGVGERLVAAVVDWARQDGATDLYLEWTTGNDPARRLYERMGFVSTGRTDSHPRSADLLEHEMRLPLVEGAATGA